MGFRESFTTEWLSVYTWQILLHFPIVCALRELICADESQNIWAIHLVHVSIYCERESPSVVSNSLQPHGLYSPWNSPGQNTGIGSCFLLPGIFPTQGSNRGLLHCRILYQLSHEGGPLYIVLFIMFYYLCSKGFALLKTFCKYLEVTGYFSVHTTLLYFLECGWTLEKSSFIILSSKLGPFF